MAKLSLVIVALVLAACSAFVPAGTKVADNIGSTPNTISISNAANNVTPTPMNVSVSNPATSMSEGKL